jgi:hypothetical protein
MTGAGRPLGTWRLSGWRAADWLIAVQLGLIALAGLLVVTQLPIWSFADERAHAGYVAALGSGHLPVLGTDQVPADVLAVGGHVTGFGASSYEAFQPPLYYAVAGIGWDLAHAIGGSAFAARTIRAFDLLCLGVALLLLWTLARRLADSRAQALAAFAVALVFVSWPGVVFRSVTISNATLEVALSAGALLTMWIAWEQRSPRAFLAAAVLCGFGLLCRLPFPPVFLLPVVAYRFRRVSSRLAVFVLAVPPLLLAPWLLDNLHRYGALTATAILKQMQGGFLNPGDKPYGLSRLVHTDVQLLPNGLLPEEWANTTLIIYRTPARLPISALDVVRGALVTVMVVSGAIVAVARLRGAWLLAGPLLIGLALTQVETAVIRLPLAEPRYVYPLLPAFGLAVGLALVRLVGPRRTALTAAGATVVLFGLWIYLGTIPTLRG